MFTVRTPQKMYFQQMKSPLLAILLLLSIKSFSQTSAEKVKLFGQVKNEWTSEGLAGVNVIFESLQTGTVTDEHGRYEIEVNKGKFVVKFSRVDMKEEVHLIDLVSNQRFDLFMKEKTFNLDEVLVYAEKADANVKNLDVGKNSLDIKKLNSIPAFLGEPDVIKSLTLLPGVSTVGEGASGFNVRGGGVDQNLILQDGAQIFNSSHVFGFFSSFNPVIVKKATLYKSGLPAKFGGRLSSVLDVELNEGDFSEYNFSGGIGLVSSKLAANGPLMKDKLSFVVAARVSYSDWLLKMAQNPDVRNSKAAFQDANFKLTYKINNKNKLTYSGYISNDKFALASDTVFSWTTTNHSLQLASILSNRLTLYSDFVIGKYSYTIEDPEGFNAFKVNSSIDFKSVRLDFTYDINEKNHLNFGIESIYYKFSPGSREPIGINSGVQPLFLEDEQSIETSLYTEGEHSLTDRLSVRAGLRFGMFNNFGPGQDFLYSGITRNSDFIVDTVSYRKGQTIASYSGLEPRITLNYKLTENSSIKSSYNRTRQYLHLVTNTAAVTPTDLWKTSNRYIQPETGDQITLGYFQNFKHNTLETSVEIYYKEADNIVDFKDGTILLMNSNIEAALINGTSEAYGLELFANKKTGKFTGWMSYTYSRIFRTVNGPTSEETINNGKKYPANNDKPHSISIAVNYKTNPIVEFGANFVYSTGRPATVPLSLYGISNQSNVFNFSGRNGGRIPDYHRLDLSMTILSKPRIDRKWNIDWTFAIYNFYGRKNAYSVFYENVYGSPPKAYKLSVLGSAFPSVMLNFNF